MILLTLPWYAFHSRVQKNGAADGAPAAGEAGDVTHWLLAGGCPRYGVTMASRTQLEFQVTPQHLAMRRFYILCAVGICLTGQGDVATPSLGKCLSLQDRCGGTSGGPPKHLAVQAQQIVLRGPFQVEPAVGGLVPPGPEDQLIPDDLPRLDEIPSNRCGQQHSEIFFFLYTFLLIA